MPSPLPAHQRLRAAVQAAERVPAVKAVCEKYGVSAPYLERRAKEVWPDFSIGRTLVDAPFSAEDKAARLCFCYEHLNKPIEFWMSVVWVDEASLVLEPTPQPAVGQRGTVVVVHDARKCHHSYGSPHLNFTLAVNGYAGVCLFGFLHTTTGWGGKLYMVSGTRLPLQWHPPLCSQIVFTRGQAQQRLCQHCIGGRGWQPLWLLHAAAVIDTPLP